MCRAGRVFEFESSHRFRLAAGIDSGKPIDKILVRVWSIKSFYELNTILINTEYVCNNKFRLRYLRDDDGIGTGGGIWISECGKTERRAERRSCLTGDSVLRQHVISTRHGRTVQSVLLATEHHPHCALSGNVIAAVVIPGFRFDRPQRIYSGQRFARYNGRNKRLHSRKRIADGDASMRRIGVCRRGGWRGCHEVGGSEFRHEKKGRYAE